VPILPAAPSTSGRFNLFHPAADDGENFALSLRAQVRIETRDDDRLILESRDRRIRFELHSIASTIWPTNTARTGFEMFTFFRPQTGFHLVAHSEAPRRGDMGSSAPGDRLIGALNRHAGNRYHGVSSSRLPRTWKPR